MRGNRGRFAILIPIAKLLPPELLCENLFGALKPIGNFGIRDRQHLAVAEAVHIAHLKAVDKQSVETGKVVGAFLQCGWMRLLEVACHRAWHVHRVLHPRPWSRRFKMESGCHDCTSQICARHRSDALQGSSSLSPIIQFACPVQISNGRVFLRRFTPACAIDSPSITRTVGLIHLSKCAGIAQLVQSG